MRNDGHHHAYMHLPGFSDHLSKIVISVKFAEIVTRGFLDLEELPVETVSWSRSGTCMK